MKNTKKSTEKRVYTVLIAFLLFCVYLLFNIFKLDYLLYDYYVKKTYDQITTSSSLGAKRGNIYDSNLNLLATSNTVWRIFIYSKELKNAEAKSGIDYSRVIAEGLGPILSLNTDKLYSKIKNSKVLDVTIKNSVEEEEYRKVLNFITENSLERLVFTEADTSRYYPQGKLAAHVLGFTGSDNQGLYGLEYYYDKTLKGTDGYYVYAKDATGKELYTEYSSYFPATDGNDLITTIDSYLQSELEAIIEKVQNSHAVNNRVCGVVMDTETGAILAMATTGAFDPNDPFTLDEYSQAKLDDCGYAKESEEYKKYKTELMQTMWSNKAISETYEPGSTFKIVTVSAALDSKSVKTSDTFSCPGYHMVGGWRIRCHKTTGHGSGFNLAYGLQMSCNPCMINVAERMGVETFYSYVKSFGYLEKTGIDLPSEAKSIFHDVSAIGPTELATSSFGQRFKVSVINQLTAVAAVANGGNLVTPYVVDKIIDPSGNIVFQHETQLKRQVISTDVANTVSQILIDGVDGNGGAKNAGVSGYKIAAKTGTSQKFDVLDSNGNSYLRIGSTVAYSTSGDKGIAVIIVVDEPTTSVKYGSVVAAPYVSEFMEKALPYLDYKSSNNINTTVENYVDLDILTAKKLLEKSKTEYEIIGNGQKVLNQMPPSGETLTFPLSKIILYTEDSDDLYTTVPQMIGERLDDAIRLAIESGLNVKLSGNNATNPSPNSTVSYQSLPYGKKIKRGAVVTIRAISTEHED